MPVPDGNPDLTNKVLENNDERKDWNTWMDLDHLYEKEKQVWLEPSVPPMFVVAGQEEHNYLGGLGESVARVLSTNQPTPQEFVATKDTFGESGTPAQLMDKYGLNAEAIVKASEKVIQRK